MANNHEEGDRRLRFPKLTRDNYQAWSEHVRDYCFEQNLDNLFTMAQADEPAALPNPAAGREDRLVRLRKAWTYIRNHLDEEMFALTNADDQQVTFGEPLSLLRFLRRQHIGDTAFDRHLLREQYLSFRFEDYRDMDIFIAAFKKHIRVGILIKPTLVKVEVVF